jgi:hypothetical protein
MGRGAEAHVLVALALISAAACGGAGGEGAGPPVQTGGATTATTAFGGTATTLASATTTTTALATTTTTGHVDMKAPVASAMGADLQALGLDPKNLPPIEKLDPKQLRGVMKLLARSLGGKCADCHTEGDFAAQTRRKKIATKMWDEFAAKLTTADGAPMFCDSCHQGRIVQLDRTDKKALGKWMEVSFVQGLERKDGKSEECESCHVGMEMHFLADWGK